MRQTPETWSVFTDPETGTLRTRVPLLAIGTYDDVTTMDGNIAFRLPGTVQVINPPADLLERFLGAKTEQQLVRFAKRYGPLDPPGLRAEMAALRARVADLRRELGQPVADEGHYRESLASWHQFRWELDFLLALAAKIREGEDVLHDPLDECRQNGVKAVDKQAELMKAFEVPREDWLHQSKSMRRARAAAFVAWQSETLVSRTGLQPAIVPVGERFQFVMASSKGPSLRSALVAQFLAAATGSGFASCNSCGRVFVPTRRRPAFGKRRYCPDCGRTAALRDAKADYNRRQRENGRKKG